MNRTVCAFNRTRESFLGLRIAAADTSLLRLKGLLGRIRLKPDDGIWLIPSRGIHTIGMLFAIDLVYLDAANRVIHLIEHLLPFRISPVRINCASILELPCRAIFSSNTQIGDELLICAPEQMKQHCTAPQVRLSADAGHPTEFPAPIGFRPAFAQAIDPHGLAGILGAPSRILSGPFPPPSDIARSPTSSEHCIK